MPGLGCVVATSHVWLLSICNVATEAEDPTWELYLILIGVDCHMCHLYSFTVSQFLIKFNRHLTSDPAILLLSIYPGEMKTYEHIILSKCL